MPWETLLVDEEVAEEFLPRIAELYQEKKVELRGCRETQRILGDAVVTATEEDWYTEYLGPILAIKVVSGVEEAIEHINQYGSHHTDSIITENLQSGSRISSGCRFKFGHDQCLYPFCRWF